MVTSLDRRQVLAGLAGGLGYGLLAPAVRAQPVHYFASRREFVDAVKAGFTKDLGSTVGAGQQLYLRSASPIGIADLPGWIPSGTIEVEHFGARGDLVVREAGVGYIRDSGTDDRPAFIAADRFAKASGADAFFGHGKYLIRGELALSSHLQCRAAVRSVLWLQYGAVSPLERGIWLNQAGAGISRFDLIGQYTLEQPKPRNNGNFGTIVSAGEYYTPHEHRRVSGVTVDVRMCRAASTPEQKSAPSTMCVAMGRTTDSKFLLGTHGRTNVASNALFLAHWGCAYDAKSIEQGNPDKTSARIIETYHPARLQFQIATPTDNRMGHGFSRVFELAAAAECKVGDVEAIGLQSPYWISSGDVVDAFAAPEFKNQVNRGHLIGHVRSIATKATTPNAYMGFFRGVGTSKFERYAGTNVMVARQATFDVRISGHDIEAAAAGSLTKGIYVKGALGRIDLGRCRITGAGHPIEIEHSDADISFDLKNSTGTLSIEFSRGVHVRGAGVRNQTADKTGRPAPAISVVGRSVASRQTVSLQRTSTIQNASSGQTRLAVHALSEPVFVGDSLRIGELRIAATDHAPKGAISIECAHLPMPIPAGTLIEIEQLCRVASLNADFNAEGPGLAVTDAVVENCNLSAAVARGAIVRLHRGATVHLTSPPRGKVDSDSSSRIVLP